MTSSSERIREVIHRATGGMSPEQLEWRRAGKWSAAEILEHLSLTYSGSTLGLNRCIQVGKTLARKPSLKDRIVTFVVVTVGYLPSGREAPQGTRPKGLLGTQVVDELNRNLEAMDVALQQCEQRFGTSTKLLNHPILGPLTGPEWRRFHLVHARHHAKQILKLRDNLQGRN